MIDNSSCIGAVNTIKGHVADCFERCSAKGSTFTGTRKLINLDSAISLIPQTVTSAKPYKCKLTHIESTGTQYIDTGFKPKGNTRVVVDAEILNSSNSAWIFGGRHTATQNTFGVFYTGSGFRHDYNNSYSVNLNKKWSGRQTIDKNKNVLTVGGTSVTQTYADFSSNYSLWLFNMNGAGTPVTSSNGALKWYSSQIYDNGTLVRDYIPVLDWSDIPCLYDEVDGTLYYNKGTGEFIAGDIVGTSTAGTSFIGFGVTWAELPEESFTIDFGAYGTGWTALSCYSNSKDGHFNIIKISSSMCIISSAYFVDLESAWDDNYGIYPMARGTYRASYSISGNSITFTNAEYDGTGNGMTNYDDFRDMPMQVSNEVNDYYINNYRLDRITVVY